MKLLVVGMGSIGRRHARIAHELGWDVAVVSQYPSNFRCYANIAEALQFFLPEAIIIAKPTNEHFDIALEIESRIADISVLVEKPLFDRDLDFAPTRNRYFVAYNLRFHPVFQRVKELLRNSTLVYAHVTVGSFLPSWRPESDYRQSYSASRAKGGGVVLDLSHELDCLMNWFGTEWTASAITQNSGALEIDSDDLCMALLQRRDGSSVFLHLDYLSRIPFRRGVVQCLDKTILYDFINPSVRVSDQAEEAFVINRDDTYRAQLLGLAKGDPIICTLQEGRSIMRLADELQARAVPYSHRIRL